MTPLITSPFQEVFEVLARKHDIQWLLQTQNIENYTIPCLLMTPLQQKANEPLGNTNTAHMTTTVGVIFGIQGTTTQHSSRVNTSRAIITLEKQRRTVRNALLTHPFPFKVFFSLGTLMDIIESGLFWMDRFSIEHLS